MVQYKIESSGHEILFSTSFLTYDDGPCMLTFSHLGVDFKVNITFRTDSEKTDARVDYTTDGPCFNLGFVNFGSQLGNGNINAWQPGVLNNRPISFRFHISLLGKDTKCRRVELTMYLAKEVQK